ncbi:MAG: methyltransferase domain-containing protein [Candidatus Micrarchaeota archaeon]|nr:methyltransferase domain-containing protein [Candidatus Micrarchaeota archaeon]
MQRKLNDLLACPGCGGRFSLKQFKVEKGPASSENIVEGLLTCKCGECYPIINSIPRILPDAFELDPSFITRHSTEIPKKFNEAEIARFRRLNQQTRSRFEFQWEKFGKAEKIYGRSKKQEFEDFFKHFTSPSLSPEYFKGKLVLEAGSGHGRYVEHMAELGAEVIGIDIGSGIDVAYSRVSKFPNAHLIQADILNLPFGSAIFDYVFSLGVIHHTPDTRLAFKSLAKLVKSGGWFSVWVYPKGGPVWETVNPLIRKVTSRLPPRVLYHSCWLAVPMLYVVPTYSGTSPRKNTWKECVQCVYDWFSPQYQSHHAPEEIASWFREDGFGKVEILDVPTGITGRKGAVK